MSNFVRLSGSKEHYYNIDTGETLTRRQHDKAVKGEAYTAIIDGKDAAIGRRIHGDDGIRIRIAAQDLMQRQGKKITTEETEKFMKGRTFKAFVKNMLTGDEKTMRKEADKIKHLDYFGRYLKGAI